MAAPPSKPSPSNKEVQQSTTEDNIVSLEATKVKAAAATSSTARTIEVTTVDSGPEVNPWASAAAASSPTTAATMPMPMPMMMIPTYESSEASEYYILGKELLSAGDFEQALQTVEQGIEESKAILMSIDVNVAFELHECMAPFHYLYGTTLLYSIEESNDTQMTVGDSTNASASAASAGEEQQQEQQQEQPQASNPAIDADDMEIAWENLEAARNILDLLLAQDMPQQRKAKLQSDLAQTLLREGDLQRMNGRYTEAIHDYEACLQLRRILLGTYDRKIADAQYNLGLSYLSHSTELQKEDVVDDAKQKVSQEHCRKGIQLYLECAKTMCGQIALLCGVEPDTVLTTSLTTIVKDDDDDNNNNKMKEGGFKTTGMEEDDIVYSEASSSLSVLRKNVADLTPMAAGDYTVEDLKQLLDEIQETVDESQRSQDAVRQAAEIKNQAKRAVEAIDDTTTTPITTSSAAADGSTTTIGFDKPTLPPPGAAAAAAAVPDAKPATAAPPMMVVKKKKKREAPTTTSEHDVKLAPDAKRAKEE
jgi:tetratricopeptide (TPR) repeat protein